MTLADAEPPCVRAGALGLGSQSDAAQPTAVALAQRITHVAAGAGFSLFVTADGQVLSCGSGEFGQTGQGREAAKYVLRPTPIRELQGMRVVSVAAGATHAAAVTDKGAVYCWGYGKDGQIGDGNREVFNFSPVEVAALKGKGVVSVACGGGHTGALTQDGTLYLWGRGRSGQLGEAADKLGMCLRLLLLCRCTAHRVLCCAVLCCAVSCRPGRCLPHVTL
jgi:alpha-tubulin suppressor-like RCC1 family protein